MDVDQMTREQMIAHARGCMRCAQGDDELLDDLDRNSDDELGWFITTSHESPWDAS
ncbi:hypothetical protein AB0395_44805 [Streptosporangium sp. NPDC051023]|uniref:hypothetical protein n=1 Tax=Streptosporangium sp. NPDC051023 TaxID=3155410 RepID=UPI00344D1E47